jgi:hypothetical protein
MQTVVEHLACQTLLALNQDESDLNRFVHNAAQEDYVTEMDSATLHAWKGLEPLVNVHTQYLYWVVDLAVAVIKFRLKQLDKAQLGEKLAMLASNMTVKSRNAAEYIGNSPQEAVLYFKKPDYLGLVVPS